MQFLVTYDIATGDAAGERRLARVAKICEGYGVRVQKSVFECSVDRAELERLAIELMDAIDPSQDSVLIYEFAGDLQRCRRVLGRPRPSSVDGPWVI